MKPTPIVTRIRKRTIIVILLATMFVVSIAVLTIQNAEASDRAGL